MAKPAPPTAPVCDHPAMTDTAQPLSPLIHGYHAHVYFDAGTVAQARALCEAAARRFPLKMGRVHEKPVGPHPDWSCQLAFKAALFDQVIPWLAMNRDGLVVFIHPITGQDLIDHRDRAMWMGAVRPLDLSVLPEQSVDYDL
jgi:aromatic ring-cleaving dioxygenase